MHHGSKANDIANDFLSDIAKEFGITNFKPTDIQESGRGSTASNIGGRNRTIVKNDSTIMHKSEYLRPHPPSLHMDSTARSGAPGSR